MKEGRCREVETQLLQLDCRQGTEQRVTAEPQACRPGVTSCFLVLRMMGDHHLLLHVVVTGVHLLPPQHLQGHVHGGGGEAAL